MPQFPLATTGKLPDAVRIPRTECSNSAGPMPQLAPIKLAVIPLKRNDGAIVNASKELKSKLQKAVAGRVLLENTGNIGKSYRKHDEIGTPACITVDFQSIEDNTYTIRDRDTMSQERVHLEDIRLFLAQKYNI